MSLSKMQVAEREGLIFQDQRPENPTFLSDQLKLSHTRFHGHLRRSCNHRLKGMLRDSFHAVQGFPLCLALADRRLCDLNIKDQRSEEHTSELQSLMRISYAVFCLKKKI